MQLGQSYRVVAVSSNANSFGLKQCVMVARDGSAYTACANSLNLPKQGEDIFIPFVSEKSTRPNFAAKGFEIPEQIESPPQEVLNEIYPN